jgi:hypothetical protein
VDVLEDLRLRAAVGSEHAPYARFVELPMDAAVEHHLQWPVVQRDRAPQASAQGIYEVLQRLQFMPPAALILPSGGDLCHFKAQPA